MISTALVVLTAFTNPPTIDLGPGTSCFVLRDLETGETFRVDETRCAEPQPPCSTFKLPNAMIGLETKVLENADHEMTWDGVERSRAVNNQDHTLRSAVEHSVVWYFQIVARRVGAERMQAWLDAIEYGNRDISAGIDQFWLTSSLEISADEQLEFLTKLAARELPCRDEVMTTMLDILPEREAEGLRVRGKTGSGRLEEGDLGWFVGYVEDGDRTFAVAANVIGDGTWGWVVRDRVEAVARDAIELLDAE